MTAGTNMIAAEQKMWRYMTFSRFLWLLQCKKLWLSRADLLGDPWEIALAGNQLQRVIERHPPTTLPLAAQETESAIERSSRIIEKWRKTTFVNCWCASDHESHALWRIYCGSTEGIALETNFDKLRSSLRNVDLFKVSYNAPGINLNTPTLNDLVAKKRPMFEYEHEFRIVKNVEDVGNARGYQLDWSPEEHLIRIRVHPEADESFMETVASAVSTYAPVLKDIIVWSDMRARPPF